MPYEVITEQATYEMKDGQRVFGDFYYPEHMNDAKGILFIIHGMAEHRKRYASFARFMAKKNYIVYVYDQRGHGETAGSLENVGYMNDIDNFKVLVEDAKTIIDYVSQKDNYARLPIYLLGHSMGSFVVQRFIELYSSSIDGAILSGSNYVKSGLYSLGRLLAKIVVKTKGRKHRSKLLNNMSFGSYNKPFKPNRTNFDWLSENEKNVDDYIADPYCGGLFSCSYFMDLLYGFKDITENVETVRPDLPIFIAGGQDDPVSNMGKGLDKLEKCYQKYAIKDVAKKIYQGKRHEILNENGRDEVYNDILNWINSHNNK